MGKGEDDGGLGLATKVGLSAAAAWMTYSTTLYYKSRAALAAEQRKTIGQMSGSRVVVTGANCGIGFATAQELARRGAEVVLGCRNPSKCKEAVQRIKQAVADANVTCGPPLDLNDLDSVSNFANEVGANQRVDVLVNNAGMMSGSQHTTRLNGTEVETTFAVNHIGTMALSMGLLPALLRSSRSSRSSRSTAPANGAPRIVTVSSRLEKSAKLPLLLDELESSRNGGKVAGGAEASEFSTFGAYADSKQANILFTKHLATMLSTSPMVNRDDPPAVSVFAVTPGMVNTQLGRWSLLHTLAAPLRYFLLPTAETGAAASIFAACDPSLEGKTGRYYGRLGSRTVSPSKAGDGDATMPTHPVHEQTPSDAALDPVLAARLWDVSLTLLPPHAWSDHFNL